MTCTACREPRPCLFRLLDDTGAHPCCLACFLDLATAVERDGHTEIVVMIRPVPVALLAVGWCMR